MNSVLLLSGSQGMGQTFLSRERGLESIEVFLSADSGANGTLVLRLYDSPGSDAELQAASLDASTVRKAGYYRFSFPSRPESYLKDYYLTLEHIGQGSISVGVAPGDAYLDGSLYLGSAPAQDSQLAFFLGYDPWQMALGLLGEGLKTLWQIVLTVLLFVLPGWALFSGLWPRWDGLAWAEKLALSSSAGLAVYPVLFLWTDLAGIHLGPFYAWIPLVAAAVFLCVREVRASRRPAYAAPWARFGRWTRSPELAADLGFIVVLLLLVGSRFWVIRTLDYPNWADSVHHTLIAQLLVNHGGLFQSWQPYAELQSLTYHFGFHSTVAVDHWLSGQSVPQAVLWMGQTVNVIAVLALYPLAVRLGRNRWAGVAAMLVGGLLGQMPMYYVNWGRYTQLAGQAILPATLWVTWALGEEDHRAPRALVLGSLLWGGLALTHYRVLIFGVCFVVAFFLFQFYPQRGPLAARLRRWAGGIAILGVGGGLLFLPWFLHISGGNIMRNFGAQLATPASGVSEWTRSYNSLGGLSPYLPPALWAALAISVLWSLWRHEKDALLVVAWGLVVVLATNPSWVGLPGEGALSNFAIALAAYVLAGLFIGAAIGWAMPNREGKLRAVVGWSLLAITIALGGWGAYQRTGDLDLKSNALITRPDERAAVWIRQNTPPDSRFLVSAFFSYGESVLIGTDGGWWLPYVAGRLTTLPPMSYGTEKGPVPGYLDQVNSLWKEVQSKGVSDPQVPSLLRSHGVNYVYVGQRQGRVGYAGPQTLDPQVLLRLPCFRPVYHQDRVWIFEVQP